MYLAAISRATSAPCSVVTGVWPCAASMRRVLSSLRRSVLVATRMSGVPSQKCATSGYHYICRTNPFVSGTSLFLHKVTKRSGAHTHLVLDVGKAGGKVDGKDDEDDVALWVAQRPQSIILLLPCRVPERDLDDLAVKVSVCDVVLENGGYVRLGFWGLNGCRMDQGRVRNVLLEIDCARTRSIDTSFHSRLATTTRRGKVKRTDRKGRFGLTIPNYDYLPLHIWPLVRLELKVVAHVA